MFTWSAAILSSIQYLILVCLWKRLDAHEKSVLPT